MNEKWEKYVRSIKIRKLIYLKKETSDFILHLKLKDIRKIKEKRTANFGNKVYHYDLEKWEIHFLLYEELFIFYKLKSLYGGDINNQWTYEGNRQLFQDKEEEIEFKRILEAFSFEQLKEEKEN